MKKFLALVLAFCLMTAILPAAAEEAGSLLTLFGVSGGEGDAQGAVGTVPEGDSGLNTDSFGNMFGGTDKGEKIYSDEGKDELPGSGNMRGNLLLGRRRYNCGNRQYDRRYRNRGA